MARIFSGFTDRELGEMWSILVRNIDENNIITFLSEEVHREIEYRDI